MTAICPAGHASDESDYCSVCGAAISPAAAAGVLPVRAASPSRHAATPLHGGGCPVCGEPRADTEARFCEVCRYDFVARTGGGPPAPAPAPAPPPAPSVTATSSPWLLVLMIDPSLDTEPDPAAPPPAGEPERVFPVELAEMLVGRRDDRQNIRPAIPLHDPGASRRHAKFLFDAPSGVVSLHDLASTNGTKLNGEDVVSGSIRPLKDGDEVTLGRWTRIRLKARA